jgi:hypothetical protein
VIKIAENVYKELIPKIENGIKMALSGEILKLKEVLSNELFSLVWNRTSVEMSNRLNIPKEILDQLPKIKELVDSTNIETKEVIDNLTNIVAGLKDQIGDADLNRTVTMSYWELVKEKAKSALQWFPTGLIIGFLAGIVVAVKFWI